MIKHKRDHRYDLIKPMVETGKIMFFNDIFKYIPKTIVAKDLGKKVDRFNILMTHVEQFSLDDLFILAGFFDMENREMLNLVMNDYERSKQEIPRSIMSS